MLLFGGKYLHAISSSLAKIISGSHAHVDHIGDVTTFPLSTELVVGEGTTEHILPPYPLNEKSFIHEDCLKSAHSSLLSLSDFKLFQRSESDRDLVQRVPSICWWFQSP